LQSDGRKHTFWVTFPVKMDKGGQET
jgi:hypothetical protein